MGVLDASRSGACDDRLDEVLYTVSNEIRQILGAQRCSVQLYADQDNLIIGAKSGVSTQVEGDFGSWCGPRSRTMMWPMRDERLAPMLEGRVVRFSSLDDPSYECSYEGFYRGTSVVGLPIMLGERLVAVAMVAAYDPRHRFDPTLIEAARHAANIAAVAIAGALEVRDARRRRASLAVGLTELLCGLEPEGLDTAHRQWVSDPVVLGAHMRPAEGLPLGAIEDKTARDLRSHSFAAAGFTTAPLTEREVEILRFMGDGLTNREIGEELLLSVNTVKGYVQAILGKLEAKNRGQAVLKARELQLI